MSSFLNKGKRNEKKNASKRSKHVIQEMKLKIKTMNEVVNTLNQDPSLTIENYPDKVKEITKVPFTEKQHELMKDKIVVFQEGDDFFNEGYAKEVKNAYHER